MTINFEIISDILSKFATIEFIGTFLIGIIGGIVIGALPGFSSTMGIALLIPITFGMDPVASLTMLTAIYAASTYGGSFSAILIHTPGTSSSVVTSLDGYQMTLKGEGLEALGISTVSSVIGGIIGAIALLLIAPPLARVSLKFGAPEYFLLALWGLTTISGLSTGSIIKGLFSGVFGLFLGTVGVDIVSGFSRYTFGSTTLQGGISMIPPMIGLFSLAEALVQMEKIGVNDEYITPSLKGKFLPSWKEFKGMIPTISLSSIIGIIIGILPAAGGDIAAWVSYDQAKRLSKEPDKFGKGHPHGIAAAEAANNAACGGTLIPLLTLGIPGGAAAAVLMGGLLIQGLHPGHELFTKNITITYSIIIGFLLANIVMGFVGWAIAKHVVKVSAVSKWILVPLIIVLSVIGSYAVNMNIVEVYLMIFFGVLGYFMRKADYSNAAVILGLILGPIVETGFLQSLVMAKGNVFMYYISRPICLIIAMMIIITLLTPVFLRKRNEKKDDITFDIFE